MGRAECEDWRLGSSLSARMLVGHEQPERRGPCDDACAKVDARRRRRVMHQGCRELTKMAFVNIHPRGPLGPELKPSAWNPSNTRLDRIALRAPAQPGYR